MKRIDFCPVFVYTEGKIMQYKIPQNVQLEDKILSFLTMKQLIICTIGGGIAYFVYVILAKSYFVEIWGLPVFLIAGLTAAIAFLRINDISFTRYLLLALEFSMMPQQRRWDKRGSANAILAASIVVPQKAKKAEEVNTLKKPQLSSLEELSHRLDAPQSVPSHPLDEVADEHLAAHVILGEEKNMEAHKERIDEIDEKRKHEALLQATTLKKSEEPKESAAPLLEHRPSIEDLFVHPKEEVFSQPVAPIEPVPAPVQEIPEEKKQNMASVSEESAITKLVSEVVKKVEIESRPAPQQQPISQRREEPRQSRQNERREPVQQQNRPKENRKNGKQNPSRSQQNGGRPQQRQNQSQQQPPRPQNQQRRESQAPRQQRNPQPQRPNTPADRPRKPVNTIKPPIVPPELRIQRIEQKPQQPQTPRENRQPEPQKQQPSSQNQRPQSETKAQGQPQPEKKPEPTLRIELNPTPQPQNPPSLQKNIIDLTKKNNGLSGQVTF